MELISKSSRLPTVSTESLPLPNSSNTITNINVIHRCLDYARRHLVTAMKYGKVLAINLGTAAVDFKNQFNDEMVGIKYVNNSKNNNDDDVHPQSFFPPEVFIESGRKLHEEGWAERLFREEDMRPHKNFAICRKEFRVIVVSQIDEIDIDEMLFKEALPNKNIFQLIKIDYNDDNNNSSSSNEKKNNNNNGDDKK